MEIPSWINKKKKNQEIWFFDTFTKVVDDFIKKLESDESTTELESIKEEFKKHTPDDQRKFLESLKIKKCRNKSRKSTLYKTLAKEYISHIELRNIDNNDEQLDILLDKFWDTVLGINKNKIRTAEYKIGAYSNGKLIWLECSTPFRDMMAGRWIYILPEYQSYWIAKKLLFATLDNAERRWLKWLTLTHLQLWRVAKLDQIATENKENPYIINKKEIEFISWQDEMNRYYDILFKEKIDYSPYSSWETPSPHPEYSEDRW